MYFFFCNSTSKPLTYTSPCLKMHYQAPGTSFFCCPTLQEPVLRYLSQTYAVSKSWPRGQKGKRVHTAKINSTTHTLENTPIAEHHIQHMYQHGSLQSSVFIRVLPLTCFPSFPLQGRHLQRSGVWVQRARVCITPQPCNKSLQQISPTITDNKRASQAGIGESSMTNLQAGKGRDLPPPFHHQNKHRERLYLIIHFS